MRDELRGDLAERLLDAEPPDTQRLDSLRKEIGAVLEKKLSKPMRLLALAGSVFPIVLAVGSGIAVLGGALEDVPMIRAIGMLAMAGGVALGGMMIWLAWRGVFHRRKHNEMYLVLAVVMLGGMGNVYLNEGWATDDARLQFFGALMLALLGFSIVLHYMEQHHLSLTQRLLEMEYRMARMDEKLDNRRSEQGP